MLIEDNNEARKYVKEALDKVYSAWQTCNEDLRGLLGPEYAVDEMAIYCTRTSRLYSFLETAVQFEGYELFNAACDTVHTEPIPSAYHIGYWFLRTPHPYRIEMMKLQGGYSPLHSGWEVVDDMDVVQVHASFKCSDETSYMIACGSLLRADYEMAQRCESSYGKFSYFINPDKSPWYLKPRINLRDAVRDDA